MAFQGDSCYVFSAGQTILFHTKQLYYCAFILILRGEQLKGDAVSFFIKNNKAQRIFHLKYPPPPFSLTLLFKMSTLWFSWKKYVLEDSKSVISESHTWFKSLITSKLTSTVLSRCLEKDLWQLLKYDHRPV